MASNFRMTDLIRTITLILFSFSGGLSGETWVSSEQKKLEATFVELSATENLTLLRENGQETSFHLSRLSNESQHLAKIRALEKKENEARKLLEKRRYFEAFKGRGVSEKDLENIITVRERQEKLEKIFSKIPDNFEARWPDRITLKKDYQISTQQPSPQRKEEMRSYIHVYESDHFRFECDRALTPYLVKKFCHLFETTLQICKALPLSLKKSQYQEKGYKHRVILTESDSDYYEFGGPPYTAGAYFPAQDLIIIPFSSLGVKYSGKKFTYDRKGDNKTLIHEIVHQLTEKTYFSHGGMGWFTEGLAEYVAAIPQQNHVIRLDTDFLTKHVKSYVCDGPSSSPSRRSHKHHVGRRLGTNIKVSSFQSFALQPYSSFSHPEDGNKNYGVSLLYIYHFLHLDRDRNRKPLKQFLLALKTGKTGEKALEALYDGRSEKELQKEIFTQWRKYGVNFSLERP